MGIPGCADPNWFVQSHQTRRWPSRQTTADSEDQQKRQIKSFRISGDEWHSSPGLFLWLSGLWSAPSFCRYEADNGSLVVLDTIGLGDTEIDQNKVASWGSGWRFCILGLPLGPSRTQGSDRFRARTRWLQGRMQNGALQTFEAWKVPEVTPCYTMLHHVTPWQEHVYTIL